MFYRILYYTEIRTCINVCKYGFIYCILQLVLYVHRSKHLSAHLQHIIIIYIFNLRYSLKITIMIQESFQRIAVSRNTNLAVIEFSYRLHVHPTGILLHNLLICGIYTFSKNIHLFDGYFLL